MHGLLAVWLAWSGDDPGRVDPDRPNIANATKTVPAGAVQLEAGVDAQVFGRAKGDSGRIAAPLVLRIGLTRRAELRFIEGDPFRWAQDMAGARQQGEVSFGAKLELWRRRRGTPVAIGLQPQLIPVSPRSSAKFWALLPGVVLLTSVEPGDWQLDFNAGFKLKPSDAGLCCDAEGLFAASFARSFADDRVSLWLEAYDRVDVDKGELSELSGDGGVIVSVSRRVALDLAVLAGSVEHETVVALLGGVSLRLAPWRRRGG